MIDRLEPRRMLSAGDLDPTFGVRGIADIPAPAVAADGSLIYTVTDQPGQVRLARALPDGTRDRSFQGDQYPARGGNLILDPATHRIAIVSVVQLDAGPALDVAMFDQNGHRDLTFDGDGVAEIRLPNYNPDFGTQAVFDAAGDLYVSVKTYAQPGRWVGSIIFRYNPGGLDSNFGDGGGLVFSDQRETIASLVPQGQKLVVLRNFEWYYTDEDGSPILESAVRLERWNSDGSQDSTFVVDSHLTQVYISAPITGMKLIGRPDNTLILFDQEEDGLSSLVGDFVYHLGIDGNQITSVKLPNAPDDVVVQADGKIITSGVINPVGTTYLTLLQRLNADGSIDLGYGIQGTATLPHASNLLIDGEDRVVMWLSESNGVERVQGGSGRLRAAPGNAALDQGILDIAGTGGADVLAISADASSIIVSINRHASSFTASSVQSIEVRAGDGNDSVTIGAGVPGTFVFGGDGNDTLRGGDGNDTLTGGGGRDLIFGGAGNDRLNGNGGNDTLSGDSGNDRVYGGNGNDSLYGGSGPDRLYGEAGDDYLKGDKGIDRLDGGDGTNHATADGEDVLIGIME